MESIAVIGIGCRFPGANDPEAFWALLRDGVDAVTEVPSERFDVDSFYDPTQGQPGKMNTRWGGFLQQVDQFDPNFFGISPREAEHMDPQQRLVLEVAWEALENAGVPPKSLSGSQTGVFVGIGNQDYTRLLCQNLDQINYHNGTGGTLSFAANRLSYLLDLHGPSLGIETACSSSLVAIHLACQSLGVGESDVIIAGGVNLVLSPDMMIAFSQARMMSADGRCKTFDASANGYVRGEGCGIVILKRLADALRDGDRILATLKGLAINQDGLSNGITAPNGLAQEAVIRQALTNAKVTPAQISYVEAHGTGTALGDPVEVNAIKAVLMSGRSSEQPCGIGSVKTNIGHLEAGAGIAGLLKVILQLHHRQIVPHLHLKELNPHLGLAETPFFIPQSCQPWPAADRLLAGVSAFSFGGTNCHVILEAAPSSVTYPDHSLEHRNGDTITDLRLDQQSWHLLTLSAKSATALQQLAQRYDRFLATHPTVSLTDVCFTANTGRSHFAHRLGIVAESTLQMRQQLSAVIVNQETASVAKGRVGRKKYPKIAFLFTGQGAQYVGMGDQLYQTQPLFRRIIDHCDQILRPHLDIPLLDLLYPPTTDANAISPQLINETAYTQPTLFALEYALAQLWMSWGIEPEIVMGHSIGEYVAACIAGGLSLEEGLPFIAVRARLIQDLPPNGDMVAVFADEGRVQAAIQPYAQQVSIATLNSPENIVISGERLAIKAVVAALEADNIQTQPLRGSHAFHSPLMEPMLDALEQEAKQISFQALRLPLLSNTTGEILPPGSVLNASHWRRHTRAPVRFTAGIQTLIQQNYNCFIEIGPKPLLSKLGQRCQQDVQATWLPSLAQDKPDWLVLLESLSVLYVQGVDVNWQGLEPNNHPRRLTLPTYPFQRKRYWINQAGGLMHGKPSEQPHSQLQVEPSGQTTQQETIVSTLQSLMARLLQITPADIDIEAPFLEMGADSLVLLDVVRTVESTYGLKISTCQLFEELRTLDALANYIQQKLPPQWTHREALPTASEPKQPWQLPPAVMSLDSSPSNERRGDTSAETALERIVAGQLQVMSQQLEVLHRYGLEGTQLPSFNNGTSPSAGIRPQRMSAQSAVPCTPWSVTRNQVKDLTPKQQDHLKDLITRYTQKTPTSKQQAQAYRPVLADSRAVAGFRPVIKEMLYPVMGARAQGSRFWDVDGNEYLDMTMGFGVLLFGHAPPFITNALSEQLQQGIQIGPQSMLAGEVAELLCTLTGLERATFCNTGTEAVMTALRLARTATGRTKVALFSGSYHGHFDGVLVTALPSQTSAVPLASGVSQHAVGDVLVLEYGTPQALDCLQTHAHELAAVLVEPVQSRRPSVQPQAFLQQLRQLTATAGIALIFDEVLTGFRIHLGGAQAWFDVDADLVTYGKIVGGGLPMGIVAGKASYMKGIDGGLWAYGDRSYPQAERTFFAGTFNKNHLGMAVSKAVLQELKAQGPALQQQLNQRTSQLANSLNAYFEAKDVPIQIVHCGSLFRFTAAENLDLLFYHLLDQGVYIWEGRNCFLSTAHTDADLDHFIQAVKESIEALRQGGFFQHSSGKALPDDQQLDMSTITTESSSAATSTTQGVPGPAPPGSAKDWAQPPSANFLPTPAQINDRLMPQLQELARLHRLDVYGEGIAALEALCITYVLDAFRQMGGELLPGQIFSTESIAQKFGVVPSHQALLGRLLEMLAEASVLQQSQGQWQVLQAPQLPERQVQEQQLLAQYPAVNAELTLLQTCGQALAQVLQGKCYPLQLLFPNGDFTAATRLYQESPGARVLNTLVQRTVSVALERLPVGRTLRILEIGAGTGGTTAYILPKLPAHCTQYVFSDLSPLFITKARHKFHDYAFISYEMLDIEQSPGAQGIDTHQYDLIVAANVLHATQDLRQALKHVLELLVPRGLLVLMEGTAPQRWLDLIFGLTEGWWKFADHPLRSSYPLLSAAEWQALLQKSGFRDIATFPPTPDAVSAFPQQAVMVASAADRLSLTAAQQQLWGLAQMDDEGSIAYNESVTVQLRGSLQVDALVKAVQTVVDRHEALRTTISQQGDFQQIAPALGTEVPVIDFSTMDRDRTAQVTEWITQASRQPFNFSQGPLFQVSVLKLEAELHWLLLLAHHIVVDGWSIDVILHELGAIYSANCRGRPHSLEQPLQFRDYVHWQGRQQGSAAMAADQAYWLEQLAGEIPVLTLPTDYPRPTIQTYRGDRTSHMIDADDYHALEQLSARQGCTLFMTLLASFHLLLHHLSGQDDVVIGISAVGQFFMENKSLVGYCVNVLPLRCQIKAQNFVDYLASIKQTLLAAYEHQNYPFSQLLKQLNVKRDPSHPPLITVQFNLDRFGQQLQFLDLDVKGFTNSTYFTRRDLTWNLAQTGSLLLTCTYNQDLFKPQTIRHWMRQFELILNMILKQPDIPLDILIEKLKKSDQKGQYKKYQKLESAKVHKLKNIKRKVIGHRPIK